MFIRFEIFHERDGQRQTDSACIASHGKNSREKVFLQLISYKIEAWPRDPESWSFYVPALQTTLHQIVHSFSKYCVKSTYKFGNRLTGHSDLTETYKLKYKTCIM